MRKNFGPFCGLLLVLAVVRVQGQTAAPPITNAPLSTPPAAAVALANVVATAVDDSGKIEQIQNEAVTDQTTTTVQQDLAGLIPKIDQQRAANDKLFASNPTLSVLRNTEVEWQDLADYIVEVNHMLSGRISQLDAHEAELEQMNKKWEATLARASTKTSGTPPDILRRINDIIGNIGRTTKTLAILRGQILSTQVELQSQSSRIGEGLTSIKKAEASAVTQLFVRDSAPLWQFSSPPAIPGHPADSPANTFGPQFAALRAYIAEKFPTLLIHLSIFIGLAIGLFFVRREVDAHARDDQAVQHAAQVFQVPLATAGLLALLISGFFYPLAPRLFWAGLLAAALLPAVIILRRLIEAALFPILYAMVIAYFIDQGRFVAGGEPFFTRLLFLCEMVAAGLFLVWLLRSHRISAGRENLLERGVRAYAYFAGVIFASAIIANVLGYTRLSYLVGGAILGSSYLAVILYAAVRIADGLILAMLKIWPFSLLGMVQRHYELLSRKIIRFVRWLALFYWVWIALAMFSVRPLAVDKLSWVLHYAVPYGAISISLASLLLFVFTIWGSVLLSKLIRFVLAEEIYPNLKLGPGVPYAISTMTHYAILVAGILFALEAVKVHLSNYSVLAGALGVGLGFGLQNIMNNFVSGLILLFERPIKVGDVIQVDTAVGTVESIGIRASVIRITNGSEIILPNGNLISNQVINWTFSNRQRVIDVPVAVVSKSDPHRVMELLTETAKAHPKVLKDPPPQVLFTNFAGATLNFELRAWTNSQEAWAQIRSDLSLAISLALARENIAMA